MDDDTIVALKRMNRERGIVLKRLYKSLNRVEEQIRNGQSRSEMLAQEVDHLLIEIETNGVLDANSAEEMVGE
ncbi:hypothetical protein [Halorussus litoreus]|uniref:hypothetical protein n=1 Tax=Halorussus litoreus TaxID=1710536 RepID=UPI0013005D82|nr:hypothetical protein [Halorussus litoreus]